MPCTTFLFFEAMNLVSASTHRVVIRKLTDLIVSILVHRMKPKPGGIQYPWSQRKEHWDMFLCHHADAVRLGVLVVDIPLVGNLN